MSESQEVPAPEPVEQPMPPVEAPQPPAPEVDPKHEEKPEEFFQNPKPAETPDRGETTEPDKELPATE